MITILITSPGVTHGPSTYGVVRTSAPLEDDPPGAIPFQGLPPLKEGRIVLIPGYDLAAYLEKHPEAVQETNTWEPFVSGYMNGFLTQMANWEALAAVCTSILRHDDVTGAAKLSLQNALKRVGRGS